MGRRKLEELSIDDLMLRQEEPPRKRAREELKDESGSNSDASSGPQVKGVSYEHSEHSEAGSEEEDGSEKEDGDGISEEEEDHGRQEWEAVSSSEPDILSRFSTSRVNIQPRKFLKDPSSSTHRPTSFEDFGISSALLSVLHKMSIRTPTEIQAVCIPPLLQGEYIISTCISHLLANALGRKVGTA